MKCLCLALDFVKYISIVQCHLYTFFCLTWRIFSQLPLLLRSDHCVIWYVRVFNQRITYEKEHLHMSPMYYPIAELKTCLIFEYIQATFGKNVEKHVTLVSIFGCWDKQGLTFVFYPAVHEKKMGQAALWLCVLVSMPICLSLKEKKEGVSWQSDSYYEMAGLHFNSKWPCQGQRMSACLSALLETQSYGQKQLLHKDTPSNYFEQQRTIWCHLWNLKLCMTGTFYRQ